jgi:competence protein ComEA
MERPMPPPPPFVLPPGSVAARARALLTGAGRQGRALAALALVALATAGVVWLRAQPRPVPADPPGGLAGLPAATAQAGPAGDPAPGAGAGAPGSAEVGADSGARGSVAVHVAGRVRHPGLVTLPAGSRVADALAAAGGAAAGADLDRLNLASRLRDGEQVLVLARGQPAPAGPAPAAGASGPLDLNTASAEQLEALPGVGQVMAERIVAYRERQPFGSVADLRQVEGIGERRLAALQGLVTVG